MRGKNAATSSGATKKATSSPPAPTKSKDRTVKSVSQKSNGSADKVNTSTQADELAKCEDCGIVITGDVAALQCDFCEGTEAWKCSKCLGMSDALYQELINNSVLKWFCRECHNRTIEVSPEQNTSN